MKEKKVLGIIFSNMHDENLSTLTNHRTMGSVPFAGRYRLIDFPLSNMVNSGIQNVGVITKSNYQSLMDHIGSGRDWDLARKRGGLTFLPPFSHFNSNGIYRGNLEALRGVSGFISHSDAEYVVMTDCDDVANIDYGKIISEHVKNNAEITVVYKKGICARNASRTMAVLSLAPDQRLQEVMVNPDLPGEQNIYMNLAVVNKSFLEHLIADSSSHNLYSFIKDVLQARCGSIRIYGYEFTGYSDKINCMNTYFNANMALLNSENRAALFLKERPVYTKVRDEVPAKYGLYSKVSNSLVADGCIIEGEVENSIIFRGVKIGKGSKVKNAIIMQGTDIGENAVIEYVICDKDVTIKDNRSLMGFETYPVFISKGSVI